MSTLYQAVDSLYLISLTDFYLVTLYIISLLLTLVHNLYCTFQSPAMEVVSGHSFDQTWPYDHSYVYK